MTQSSAWPLLDPSLSFFYFYFLLFMTIIIFSPDQKIQVTCYHRHEPRTVGPTTPTGRRPPQSGTPCRGQHLRRRAPPQGDREERTGTVGTPVATPPNQGGRKETTGAVGTPAAAPPNQVSRERRIGTIGSQPHRIQPSEKTRPAPQTRPWQQVSERDGGRQQGPKSPTRQTNPGPLIGAPP